VKFARAITTRNVFLAELALGELETVLLEDALQMVTLYGEQDDPKYAAACRVISPDGSLRSRRRWRTSPRPRVTSSSADGPGSADGSGLQV
jgi:hypothetical protein